MANRIDEIIQEIEDIIDNCKYVPLSNDYIKVNKSEIDDKIRELKMRSPEEIRRGQKIIQQKNAILADAETKAAAIVEAANVHKSELISEHQIMQQAYAQANEIVQIAQREAQTILDNAINEANSVRAGAIQYTDELLGNLENIIGHTMDTAGAKYEKFISSLKNCYEIVEANRIELNPPVEEEQPAVLDNEQPAKNDGAEDYRVEVSPEVFE